MPQDATVQDLIRQEATKQGLPPALALAVAEQESSFNPTAIGKTLPSGEQAVGTFQLLPSTAHTLGVDPHDPVQNIRGGVKYLRQLMDQHQGDLGKVLANYGGVVTDQTYVPSVLARVQKYQTAEPPTAAAATPTPTAGPPPAPRSTLDRLTGTATDLGGAILRGLDPRTATGRQNIAGGLGAAGLAAVAPEVPLAGLAGMAVRATIPAVGAYLGGGAEQAGEDVAAGQTPSLAASHAAGVGQATNEAVGQGLGWFGKALVRRPLASGIAKKISTGLSDALDAASARISSTKPAVTPSEAGRLVDAVAQGPAKSVKDALGEAVGKAAASGPPIPTAPLRAKLDALAAQIQPMASHAPAAEMVGGVRMGPEQITALATAHPELGLTALPADHPLPKVLDATREALRSTEALPFEDAHKIKRLLDEAVNWDSPAKKQAQQITKGFRQDLRSAMSGHAPYNDATAAYQTVARLYTKPVQKLHQEILSNPEGIVAKVNWKNPSSAQMLKDLTVDVPAQAGTAEGQQGEAAWNALRASWTHEHLVAKGPAGMVAEIAKMEGSGNGQDFLRTMYGDPQWQIVLQNLKQLGAAWQAAQERIGAFAETKLAGQPKAQQTLADLGAAALPHGHPIYKVRAVTRLVAGPSVKEMLQWASYSDARTNFVVKHVLTGPDPGMAVADFTRWVQGSQAEGTSPDQPMASHPQTTQAGPPPAPRLTPSQP